MDVARDAKCRVETESGRGDHAVPRHGLYLLYNGVQVQEGLEEG